MQHDEYKPLSMTFTDSLGELGNLELNWLSECAPISPCLSIDGTGADVELTRDGTASLAARTTVWR